MGINIAGTTLSGRNDASSEAFKVSRSVTEILKINSAGRTTAENRIGFIAGKTTQAYISPALVTSWSNVVTGWTGTYVNYGNGFSTGTSRFTVPVSGNYMMSAGAYLYNASTNGAMYPGFLVNGSRTGRMAGLGPVAIRNHVNYYGDGQLSDVLKLTEGDYVEMVFYCATSTDQYYAAYTWFSGWLLG